MVEENKEEKKDIIEVKPKVRQPMKIPGRNIFINTLNVISSPAKPFSQRYKRTWQESKHHFFLDTILVLIVLLLIGINVYYFIIYQNLIAGDRGVDLSLELPETVISGQEINIKITYSNNKKKPLNQSKMELLYPSGFIYLQSIPEPRTGSNNLWDLGTIETEGVGTITINGLFYGSIQQLEKFDAILSFNVGQSQVLSQQVSVNRLTVEDSYFALQFHTPEAVLKNRTEDYSIAYSYNGTLCRQPVRIDLNLPEDFTLTQSQPELNEERQFHLGEIVGRTNGEVNFSGYFTDDQEQNKNFSANLLLALGDEWFQQAQTSQQLKILKPTVDLNYQVNQNVASWGDYLAYTTSIHNTGDSQLADLTLRIAIENQYFDLNQSNISGATIESNRLIFGQQASTVFSTLDPGAEAVFDFSLKLKSAPPNNAESLVTSQVEIYSQKAGEFVKGVFLGKSRTVSTKINSLINFSSIGRIFGPNGEQFGFGSIPPKVNLPTNYRIFWTVDGNTNSLEAARVYTTLPGGVKWTGNASISGGQQISFNPGNRTVTWDIGTIAVDPQSRLQANFLLEVVPNNQQVGLVLPLINHTVFQAQDSYTGATISEQVGGVTTDIPGDPQAAGQGRVVE